MKIEDQRIAIAEACGWIYPGSTCLKTKAWGRWIPPNGTPRKIKQVPDYLNDLNAMHEAEKALPTNRQDWFSRNLLIITDGGPFDHWKSSHATAAQRVEAYLRTLNLWKE